MASDKTIIDLQKKISKLEDKMFGILCRLAYIEGKLSIPLKNTDAEMDADMKEFLSKRFDHGPQ